MDPDPGGAEDGLTALGALRRYVRPRAPRERCELCGASVPVEHPHLIEPATRRLLCGCDACALLFSGAGETRYRRVPRRVEVLPRFRLSDAMWESLNLPINLAFFFRSTPARGVVALYPSPAGATESLVAADGWGALAEENPWLHDLEPDVEGILVNRLGEKREHYRVGIDECYRLVGLIRLHWRGLSGGAEVWSEIDGYFTGLKGRASHA
jgi:hypothetical protein